VRINRKTNIQVMERISSIKESDERITRPKNLRPRKSTRVGRPQQASPCGFWCWPVASGPSLRSGEHRDGWPGDRRVLTPCQEDRRGCSREGGVGCPGPIPRIPKRPVAWQAFRRGELTGLGRESGYVPPRGSTHRACGRGGLPDTVGDRSRFRTSAITPGRAAHEGGALRRSF